MDAQPRVRIQTWEELLNYCYYVASVVGLVMSHILGADNPLRREAAKEQAIALGTAMQLTNILRDVREDLEKDRIYLPMRELAAHGVDVGRAAQGDGGNAWRDYALFFTARAREFYEEAERGIGTLDRDGSRYCVWCMRWIYAAILDEIEKAEWDISRRHRVGGWRKLSLAIRAWRSSMNTPS
jgi:phytoene synthase